MTMRAEVPVHAGLWLLLRVDWRANIFDRGCDTFGNGDFEAFNLYLSRLRGTLSKRRFLAYVKESGPRRG